MLWVGPPEGPGCWRPWEGPGSALSFDKIRCEGHIITRPLGECSLGVCVALRAWREHVLSDAVPVGRAAPLLTALDKRREAWRRLWGTL